MGRPRHWDGAQPCPRHQSRSLPQSRPGPLRTRRSSSTRRLDPTSSLATGTIGTSSRASPGTPGASCWPRRGATAPSACTRSSRPRGERRPRRSAPVLSAPAISPCATPCAAAPPRPQPKGHPARLPPRTRCSVGARDRRRRSAAPACPCRRPAACPYLAGCCRCPPTQAAHVAGRLILRLLPPPVLVSGRCLPPRPVRPLPGRTRRAHAQRLLPPPPGGRRPPGRGAARARHALRGRTLLSQSLPAAGERGLCLLVNHPHAFVRSNRHTHRRRPWTSRLAAAANVVSLIPQPLPACLTPTPCSSH